MIPREDLIQLSAELQRCSSEVGRFVQLAAKAEHEANTELSFSKTDYTLIIAGLIAQSGATQVSIKLVLILILLFLTSPTATHALAQAALASGLKPWAQPDQEQPPPEEDR